MATVSAALIPDPVTATLPALRSTGMAGFCGVHSRLFERYFRPGFSMPQFQQRTQRAKAPLQSCADLVGYNAFYAAPHAVAFSHLLALVSSQFSEAETWPLSIKVVDYGCGQGLATLVLLHHLRRHTLDGDLHLIEPSPLGLDAARRYVWDACDRTQGHSWAHPHRCRIDEMPASIFMLHPKYLTVHMFSNVLDLADAGLFDLDKLMARLASLPGEHLLLATGPAYPATWRSFQKVKAHLRRATCIQDTTLDYAVPLNFGMISMRGKGQPVQRGVRRCFLALRFANTSHRMWTRP